MGSALRLLKTLSAEEPEMGITALSARLGLAKSTVHRLVSTLVSEGFLERNPVDGRYRLGLLLFSMGTLVRRRMNVAEESVPLLHSLCERSGETIHLAVLHDSEILYLRNIESQHAIRPRSYLGVRKPAFCTSEGRALLAFSPPLVLAQVLRAPLVPRTPHTITDKAALQQLLEKVRHCGYAVDDEESEVDMRGVAAPIFDATGSVVAAVGLAGPTQRLPKAKMHRLAAMVVDSAQAISKRLGYSPRDGI
ncbi:IclR family transcriptional regulator [Ottowia caeni]|uniref:IclR family transcriptional regulator n=1 Tax=Ottowia caeni TaxID=2870339 RepID=UPI003D709AD5